MSSKIKVDTIENVAGSGNVSLGSGHNLVVPGNLNVDTNLLDVDASNDTVGIGTTVNTRKLNINAGSYGHMLLDTADAAHGIQILGQTNSAANSGFDIQYAASTGMKIRTLAVQPLSLQTSASAGNPAEALKIDTAGRVTQPLQISFFAGWTTTSNAGGYGSVQYGNAFGTVGWNIGSGWDSAGTFTAPVAGKYLVYLAMSFTSGANRIHAGFYINGGGGTTSQGNSGGDPWLQTGRGNDGSSDQDHVFVSKVFNLNANDTLKPVYLIFDNDNNSQIYQHRTYVGGYLLG